MSIKTRVRKLEKEHIGDNKHDKAIFYYWLNRDKESLLKCSLAQRQGLAEFIKESGKLSEQDLRLLGLTE